MPKQNKSQNNFLSYQDKKVKFVIVKHFIVELLPKLCVWPSKKCSCSTGKFIFWWGKSWDWIKCWWLQTVEATWKWTEKWVDAISLSLVPGAVVLLEAWAQRCRGDAQFVLLKCRALRPCSLFSPCQWKGFGLFQRGWAGSWKLLLLIMLRWKPHAHESLQNSWSSLKNKLFLHIEEQFCQVMWLAVLLRCAVKTSILSLLKVII